MPLRDQLRAQALRGRPLRPDLLRVPEEGRQARPQAHAHAQARRLGHRKDPRARFRPARRGHHRRAGSCVVQEEAGPEGLGLPRDPGRQRQHRLSLLTSIL